MEAAIALKTQVALDQLAGPERSREMQVESVTRFGAARPADRERSECMQCRLRVMGAHTRADS